MNIRRIWVKLVLLFVVAAAIGFAIPSTLAYITAQSNIIVNTFDAPYFPPEPTSVEVRVHKTVQNIGKESIGPEDFRFELQNVQNSESFTLTTGENGYASIVLPFSDADLGRIHTYHLYEINDKRENIAYSDAVYAIQITLSVNADNQIVAAAAMNGQPVEQIVAEFENIYNAGVMLPPTGDTSNVELYAALLLISGVCLIILLTRRDGRVLK